MKPDFVIVLLILPILGHAGVITGKDEQAQLPFWQLETPAMTLRLVQRLPDQTRAYFAGRGFNKADVDYIASYCVFQSVFTNTASAKSPHVIEYDARDWRIVYHGKELPLMLRESWRDNWKQRGAKQAQKIAFEWSLLPSQQRYEATDYNWGMTVYKLPHGSQFDLKLSWMLDGKKQNATIRDMKCAADIYVPPAEQVTK